MAYFGRLTDIVTCNLTSLIARADDPGQALEEIIREIREGIAGAQRSAHTAAGNVERIGSEIAEQRDQIAYWVGEARKHLAARNDDQARQSLLRKREVEDLIAALDDQLRAATATRDHLTTTLHALQARLADAERRRSGVDVAGGAERPAGVPPSQPGPSAADRNRQIEAELERLRQELGSR